MTEINGASLTGSVEGEATLAATPTRNSLLFLGALGIVYGDIGTSPIYALREALRAASGKAMPAPSDIIGSLSIIVWSLTIIVAIKYGLIILRADNKGEGGTLSMMTLARSALRRNSIFILALGMIGAALFFGDAVITPAISVLSAVEGLDVAAPAVSSFIIPITVTILVILFSVQRYGTERVSSVFGPIMLIWFLVLGLVGLWHIVDSPAIFWALNPYEAIHFAIAHRGVAFAVAGAAFLAVTGGEAIYADLGHFGRKPIVQSWFSLVFPCLVLNYFGQGAFLLNSKGPISQPLFQMMPHWALLPMVLLATAATVIASQAVISGAFSIARQATQLHFFPRLDVVHTSATQSGQIYLPQINWLMLIGVLTLVMSFRSSEAIAAAYGISVSGQMVVTTMLLVFVMKGLWRWKPWAILLTVVPLFFFDLVFLSANALKLFDGGWVSVEIAVALMVIMYTWTTGSKILLQKTQKTEIPLDTLIKSVEKDQTHIVPGTAVFFTSDPTTAPTSLLHSLKHYKVLHTQNVVVTVRTQPMPRVPESERVELEIKGEHFMQAIINFGYMEDPNVPRALKLSCKDGGLKFDIMSTSFFLSRRSLKSSRNVGMPVWQDKLFILLARNAADASSYFALPTGRVVEIGTQVII